jgi:hypothetical protein
VMSGRDEMNQPKRSSKRRPDELSSAIPRDVKLQLTLRNFTFSVWTQRTLCSRFLLCNLYLLRGWEEPKKPLRHFIQQNNKQPKLLNSKMSRHGDISSSEVRTLLHFPLPKTRGGASFVRVLSIDCLPLILAQANKLLFLRTM